MGPGYLSDHRLRNTVKARHVQQILTKISSKTKIARGNRCVWRHIFTDRVCVLRLSLFQLDREANPNVYRKMALTGFRVMSVILTYGLWSNKCQKHPFVQPGGVLISFHGETMSPVKTCQWEPGPVRTCRSQTNNFLQSVIFYSEYMHLLNNYEYRQVTGEGAVTLSWPCLQSCVRGPVYSWLCGSITLLGSISPISDCTAAPAEGLPGIVSPAEERLWIASDWVLPFTGEKLFFL